MTVRVLVVGANEDEIVAICDLAVKYLNDEDRLNSVQINVDMRSEYNIPAIDAGINHADLYASMVPLQTKYDVIISRGSIWEEVVNVQRKVNDSTKNSHQRVRYAHNLIVMEELLDWDTRFWDLIFFKPMEAPSYDFEIERDTLFGSLYLSLRQQSATDLGPFVKLPLDFDEAVEQVVTEIQSAFGLDDE